MRTNSRKKTNTNNLTEIPKKVKLSLNRGLDSRVAAHLPTLILADIITIPYLRITPGTQSQQEQKR